MNGECSDCFARRELGWAGVCVDCWERHQRAYWAWWETAGPDDEFCYPVKRHEVVR